MTRSFDTNLVINLITGSMFSGKSKDLIELMQYLEEKGINFIVMKPTTDTRDSLFVKSRDYKRVYPAIPIQQMKDLTTGETYDTFPTLSARTLQEVQVIVVDEVQFLTIKGLKWLIQIAKSYNIELVLGGLTYDFKGDTFPAVQFLTDNYSDYLYVHELLAKCFSCGEMNATNSCRVINNEIVTSGEVTQVGDKEMYIALCDDCKAKFLEGKGE